MNYYLDDLYHNPFRNYGGNEFIGTGGLGYHQSNIRGGVLTLTLSNNNKIKGNDKIINYVNDEMYNSIGNEELLNNLNSIIKHNMASEWNENDELENDENIVKQLNNNVKEHLKIIKSEKKNIPKITELEKKVKTNERQIISLRMENLIRQLEQDNKKFQENEKITNRIKEELDESMEFIKMLIENKFIENLSEQQKMISKFKYLLSQKGMTWGKAFEMVLETDLNYVIQNITKDRTEIHNNNNNSLIPKSIQEFAVFDLYQENTDIEVKCYCTKFYCINFSTKILSQFDNKTKKTSIINLKGVPIQCAKIIGNYSFKPRYTYDNGKLKLFNIYCVNSRIYINSDYMKNVFIIYAFEDGIYYFNLLENLDLFDIIKENIVGTYQLYSLDMKNKTKIKDGFGHQCYLIPFDRFKKI